MRSQTPRQPLITIPKLRTTEDLTVQASAAAVDHVGDVADALIYAGPLLTQEAGPALLAEALDAIAGAGCDCDEANSARERAAYRVGLAVGLKLGRLTTGGAR